MSGENDNPNMSPEERRRLHLQQMEYDDLRRSREIASQFSNRAHVLVKFDVTRIAFGEQVVPGYEPTTWTYAVTLTTENALAIANLIYEQYNAIYPTDPEFPATGADEFEDLSGSDDNG